MTAVERRIRLHPNGATILGAIREAKEKGWLVVPGEPFVTAWPDDGTDGAPPGCCCPLGALRLKDGQDFAEAAELTLGWTHQKSWAFAYGFDEGTRPTKDDESDGMHAPEFRLGKLVRQWLEPGAYR